MRISDWSSDVCSSDLVIRHQWRRRLDMVPRSPEIVEEGAANVVGRYHARELGILRRCDKVISVDHRDRCNLSERGRDSLAQIAGQLAQDIEIGRAPV